MDQKTTVMKYYTITEYYDLETGEILTKSKVQREYIITKNKITKFENNGNYTIKKIQTGCRTHKQLELFQK